MERTTSMGGTGFEITLIMILVIANGLFSLAEMAVVSARKARLRHRAEEGSRGAAVALALAEHPHDFLSTVQVGITLIGTLAGAFGGATIAEKFGVYLKQIPQVADHAESVAITVVVLIISYLSLILGELVPKSLALSNPEAIASAVARPMQLLSRFGSPIVRFLSFSTRVVLTVLPVKKGNEAPVTEEEIKVLLAQGTAHGTFEEAEQDMVEGVFRLGARRVVDLMKPRQRVVWLDAEDDWSVNEAKIASSIYSRFPVGDGDLDRLLGVIHVKDLFGARRSGQPVDMRAIVRPPQFIPESTPALDALELFQKSGGKMAIVINEHGTVEGIVTLTDLIQAVIGDFPSPGEEARPRAFQREDGSWLADGTLPIADLLEVLNIRELPGEADGFSTVAGFILAHLNRIPTPGDHFVVENWRFEVLDMDGNRIDKVLITKLPEPEEEP